MSDWLCWVESAKAAPAQGGFSATDGKPVPCPKCGVDMRWLEADVERLAVACSCGVVVTEHYLVNHCGGARFRARRVEPGLADWLARQRRRVLLGAQRDQHARRGGEGGRVSDIEARARAAGVPVDWMRDRPRNRRVLWRDVPRRFLVIQARCTAVGIEDLDGFAAWVLPDGQRDPAVDNPGSLSTSIRLALSREQIVAAPQLRRALRALYRWEFRQCARVGYPCDPPGPGGIPRPLPAEGDLLGHLRQDVRWLEYVVGLGAGPGTAAVRQLDDLRGKVAELMGGRDGR